MREIFKRIWADPVYVGTAAIVAVSIVGPFIFGWPAELLGVIDAGIAALTGTVYRSAPPITE